MLEIFLDYQIQYAFLQEGPVLRVAYPTLTDSPIRQTMAAENCRYMDLVTSRKEYGTGEIIRNTWRIIMREGTEAAMIKELEDIGLVEVPKGAEDPEELKRVWVRNLE